MSGFAMAAFLSMSLGQVEPNYWQQWNQFGPFDMPGDVRRAPPKGPVNGRPPLPGDGFESWDWRLDPFPTLQPPTFRRVYPTRPMPIQPGRGRYNAGEAVRLSLSNLAPDSPTLRSYRKALAAMRKLPADDPHSLIFQANIHGYPATQNPDPTWGQCQHGNWWFLPWHRMYVHCFEKIVRKYAEDPTFAMPYWDYSVDRALPAAFRDPASELYDSSRLAAVNSGTDQLSTSVVVDGLTASLANTVFADFGPVSTFGGQALNAPAHRSTPHGTLEAVPHDVVHTFVGGNLALVDTAARDPIFFCHHANVDRLWVVWLRMGQGRANSANDAWLNQSFTFYDENKKKIDITVRQILDPSALGYTYDVPVPPAPSPSPPVPPAPTPPAPTPGPSPTPPSTPAPKTAVETVAILKTGNVALRQDPVVLTMVVPDSSRLKAGAMRKRLTPGQTNQIFLQLNEAHFAGVPDSTVAVYLNLPPNSSIPGPRSPYFAGYFTFFGDHHNEGYTCRLDVTRQLAQLWQTDTARPASFRVTLVRSSPGIMPRDFRAPITFKEISLSVTK